MKFYHYLFLLSSCIGILFFSSCESSQEGLDAPSEVEGMRPIYANDVDWRTITQEGPRDIQRLGKIYYKDGLIFVNEQNKGIHIIDNSNPSQPQPIHFISVLGSKDIAIKGDYLYTDNLQDLVVLDISELNNITEVNRLPGVYEAPDQNFPEFWGGYFECADPDKGLVVGWELALLNYPRCRN